MVKTSAHQERFYRDLNQHKGLVYFTVTFKETDLLIGAKRSLIAEASEVVLKYRSQLEKYIEESPIFKDSLVPLPFDPFAPKVVKEMLRTAEKGGVGPMASVAGAIAEFVGKDLLEYTPEVIVENGGDLFLNVEQDMVIGIFAGDSPLSGKLALKISAKDTPLGICTSSGTVGHSLSFGSSDAVTIVSKSTALADAVATSVGNIIKGKEDIGRGLQRARKIEGVTGALIIIGDRIGIWGNVELMRSSSYTLTV